MTYHGEKGSEEELASELEIRILLTIIDVPQRLHDNSFQNNPFIISFKLSTSVSVEKIGPPCLPYHARRAASGVSDAVHAGRVV